MSLSMPKIELEDEEIKGKMLFLSSLNFFFHITSERTFFTKWMGLWNNKHKLIDYFAVKINGKWLGSPHKIEKVGDREVAFYYSHEGSELVERMYLSNEGLLVKYEINNNEEKENELEVEVAVNIRRKEENYVERSYKFRKEEVREGIYVFDENERGVFVGFIGANSFNLEGDGYYKVHSPYPYEAQRCFVAPTLKAKFNNTLYLFISDSPDKQDKYINNTENLLKLERSRYVEEILSASSLNKKGKIKIKGKKEGEESYVSAVSSLLSLKKRFEVSGKQKDVYVAGLPWFNEFWTRDAFWASLALLDIGKFEDVKDMLLLVASMLNRDKEGKISGLPCLVLPSGESRYHCDDILPLYLIVLKNYVEYSGDNSIIGIKEMRDVLDYSLSYLRNHVHNGLVWHHASGTWMDTLDVGPVCIDIQALWLEATRIYRVLGKKEIKDAFLLYHEILLKGLRFFYKEGEEEGMWYRVVDFENYMRSIPNTANNFLLTFFSLIGREKEVESVLDKGRELISKYGIRTESYKNINYGAGKYHEGAVWLLTTGWGLASYARYNYKKEIEELLKAFIQDYKRHAIGNFSEVLNADSGDLIGAGHQLWSASMFIHALHKYVLGIEPQVNNNKIIIKPSEYAINNMVGTTIRKRMGEQYITFSVEKAKYEGDVIVRVLFEKRKLELEVERRGEYEGYVYYLKDKNEAQVLFTKAKLEGIEEEEEENGIKIRE